MENQMEKQVEHQIQAGFIRGLIGFSGVEACLMSIGLG